MQIVSSEDSLHEMSKIFSEKKISKITSVCMLILPREYLRVNSTLHMPWLDYPCAQCDLDKDGSYMTKDRFDLESVHYVYLLEKDLTLNLP